MHLYLISLKRAKHTCTDNCKSQWVPPTRFHHPCPSCLSVTIHQVPPGFLTQQRFSPTKLDMCEPKLDKCEPRLDMCEPRWPTIFIVVTAASAVTLTCPSSDLSWHQSSPQQWQIGPLSFSFLTRPFCPSVCLLADAIRGVRWVTRRGCWAHWEKGDIKADARMFSNELPYMYICDFIFFQCSVVRHFVTPTYLTGNEECRTIEYLLIKLIKNWLKNVKNDP